MSRQKETQPAAPLHRQQALSCIPIRNPEVEAEEQEEGLLLSWPVEVKPWFQSIFKRFSRQQSHVTRKLQLDVLGSSVWQMVDNQHTVAEIVERFRTTHQLGSREAELAVTGFLKDLGKRELIAMREGG